jgi:hypothetical protein
LSLIGKDCTINPIRDLSQDFFAALRQSMLTARRRLSPLAPPEARQ